MPEIVIDTRVNKNTIRILSDEGFSFVVGGLNGEDARGKGAKRIVGTLKPEFGLNLQKTSEFYEKNGFTVDGDQITCNL